MIRDATVGTPILQPVLQRHDPMERRTSIHRYEGLGGAGTTTAGVCIKCNERMFIRKATASPRRVRRKTHVSLGRVNVLERTTSMVHSSTQTRRSK
jgi:hypothetical protein